MVACLVTRGMTVTNVYPETGMSMMQTVHGGSADGRAGLRPPLERHRRELHVHCYRMLGSFTDAEDLVAGHLLAAPGGTGTAVSPGPPPGVAVPHCHERVHGRHPSRRRQAAAPASSAPEVHRPECQSSALACSRIRRAAGNETRMWAGETATVARETIELDLHLLPQSLPPRQRAVVLLCAGLGWTAAETAATLEMMPGRGEQCPAAGPRGAARSPAPGSFGLDGQAAHRRRTGHPAPVHRGARARVTPQPPKP